MGLRCARLAEIEDLGGKDGAGMALDAFDQILQIADATAGGHIFCRL